MSNKMLIDASHPEETRVVVLRGDRVEEFDFESALRKQLRGNIYLAKVTRVEPSLQAAFVDYGGNRHGFLAFNEIHPDYYQLPQADREALLEFDAQEARQTALREKEADDREATDEEASNEDNDTSDENAVAKDDSSDSDNDGEQENNDGVESVGSEDALEELPVRSIKRRKHYKIQEVIKRRQIILVQVVKEERGNKGAALTTYLSLAGRYTVLMPNTARGGGISRKIANATDRKRLRKIVAELEVPEGMGLIVRTAGASRTKAELKRDFEYLLRLWENVRDLTLKSSAPNLVYEEGNLIKRSIRDLYSKEIEEVLVAGDEEYREAKDFMRMLMPSHAKNVQPFKESEPLFTRYKIESQLNAMYSPYVTLPSGGYIVINQTEALVSVDVNSGRATKEHSIEDTALKTNLEASTEIARQLRLRDLAGLVVIDFIDMEERRNNRAVERRVKECLRNDRARIQVGRISHFGLLEMSRQRLRTGVLEGSTSPCPHCQGTGMIRSTESMALTILRALEDRLQTQRHAMDLLCTTNVDVALYILNNKRSYINDIERRYTISISVEASQDLEGVSYTIDNMRHEQSDSKDNTVVKMDWAHKSTDNEVVAREDTTIQEEDEKPRRRRRRRGGQSARRPREDGDQNQDNNQENQPEVQEATEIDGVTSGETTSEKSGEATQNRDTLETSEDGEERPRRPRRRGRRGGRRRSGRDRDQNAEATTENGEQSEEIAAQTDSATETRTEPKTENAPSNEDRSQAEASEDTSSKAETEDSSSVEAKADSEPATDQKPEGERKTRRPRRRRSASARQDKDASPKAADTDTKTAETNTTDVGTTDTKSDEVKSTVKPATVKAVRQPKPKADTKADSNIDPSSLVASSQNSSDDEGGSPRRGWWQKRV